MPTTNDERHRLHRPPARVSARLLEREDVDGEWFAVALSEYEAGAPHGLTLAFAERMAGMEPPVTASQIRKIVREELEAAQS